GPPESSVGGGDQHRGEAIQPLEPCCGDEIIALEPHTAPAGHVQARLEGDDHALCQDAARSRPDPRLFPRLEAEAVTDVMAHSRVVTAGSMERLSDDLIDVRHGGPGPDTRLGGGEGGLEGGMTLALERRR